MSQQILAQVQQAIGRQDLAAAEVLLRPHAGPQASFAFNVNLASILVDTGRHAEAATYIDYAVAQQPTALPVRIIKAMVDTRTGQTQRALEAYKQILLEFPGQVVVWRHYTELLDALGDFEALSTEVNRALGQWPDQPNFRVLLAEYLLRNGHSEIGWREWEYRWKVAPDRKPQFTGDWWMGEALTYLADPLLIAGDQGYGDTIQFARYLEMATARAPQIVFWVSPQLYPLLVEMDMPGVRVTKEIKAEDRFSRFLPVTSLPRVLGAAVEEPPAPQKLHLVPGHRDTSAPHLKVGLIWRGRASAATEWFRSPDGWAAWHSVLQTAGVQFYGLQADGSTDVAALPDGVAFEDQSGQIETFADTARLMQHMDLIITTDSAPAHLAGTLGIPTWVLLAKGADWRWGHAERTPWYPSVKLYRCPALQDWDPVMSVVARDLAELARRA